MPWVSATDVRESRVVVVLLTSIWLVTVLQYITPLLLLSPVACIPFVGVAVYRTLTSHYDRWFRLGTFAVPISWCGLKVYFERKGHGEFVDLKAVGNALVLSTHCSRIDYMVGAWVTAVDGVQARIGFVAEATAALMPIQGWWRVLLGDIFVTRAFHHDGPRIQANIDSFHKTGTERLIFLAPEGFIANPHDPVGDQYISDCDTFMKGQGRAPMTHLLTPRYKGMQHFLKHAPTNVGACAMAFVTGHPTIDKRSGSVVGGIHATHSLSDPRRSIPDLHSVFAGGLAVFVKYHDLRIAQDLAPEELKEALIADQVRSHAHAHAHADMHMHVADQVRRHMAMWPCACTGSSPSMATHAHAHAHADMPTCTCRHAHAHAHPRA